MPKYIPNTFQASIHLRHHGVNSYSQQFEQRMQSAFPKRHCRFFTTISPFPLTILTRHRQFAIQHAKMQFAHKITSLIIESCANLHKGISIAPRITISEHPHIVPLPTEPTELSASTTPTECRAKQVHVAVA